MNRNALLVSFTVSLSVLAFLFAIIAWTRGDSGEVLASLRRLESELELARRGIESLEGKLARLAADVRASTEPREMVPAGSPPAPTEIPARSPKQLEEILNRLEEVARKVDELGSRPQAVSPPVQGGAETVEDRRRIVEESQPVALERGRTPEERLQALRDLRFRDGRSHEVTLAMIELIQNPDLEPRLRADIIRNLDGVDFEELKQPLLNILRNDDDTETRSETVETLQAFYDDPTVRDAIVQVRDHDKDPRVRLEAMQRLVQHEERFGAR